MKIDRQLVMTAALDLLDARGLEGLTMRKLADALGVQAPALYWHFPNKQALLDDMAEALLEGVPASMVVSERTEDVLESLAIQLRAALLSRRDGARVFAGTFVARPNAMELAEIGFAAMARAGITGKQAVNGLLSLFYFILGFVIEEQALAEQSAAAGGAHPLSGKLAEFDRGKYPFVEALLPDLLKADHEERFRFGLNLIVGRLVTVKQPDCR